ncbi:MAG: EpsG family protein [Butyrivibrio sp.]|nr:EpsG family protein [Butyrivibrio sp.]
MGYVLLIILVYLLCLGMMLPKKEQMYVGYIGILLMIMFMGLNSGNADFSMYEEQYRNSIFFDLESHDYKNAMYYDYSRDVGYAIISAIGINNGLSFIEFRFVQAVFILGIIFFIGKRYTNNIPALLLLYMMYPFFMDVIQYRNTIVEMFLLIGCYLVSVKIQQRFVFFSVLMAIAGCFHSMGIVYILFVPFYFLLKSKWNIIIKLCFFIVCLLPLYADFIKGKFFEIAALLIGNDISSHYSIYIVNNDMHWGYMAIYGYLVIMLIVLYIIRERIKKQSLIIAEQNVIFIDWIFRLYLFCFCLLPSAVIAIDMLRWPRNLMIESYLVMILYLQSQEKPLYKVTLVGLGLIVSFVFGYWNLYQRDFINVIMIIEQNILFDIL